MATMIHQKVSFTASPCELFTIYLDSKYKAGPSIIGRR
jgi:hypothetical protein